MIDPAQVRDIFDRAVQLAPADRAEFLQHACHNNAGLQREVERLIAAFEKHGDLFDSAMSDRERIGRYEVLSAISQGGMGSVFLARDPQLSRQVAVKLLLESLDSDEWRRRFHREAKALARLDHPNVVAIFDFGEDDRGRPYIVMELVRGQHLGGLFGFSLPLVQKLGLLEQLCAGLDCAHQAGIVHLDIKPPNLIVDGSGRLRIVDFGIARGFDSRVTRPTVPDPRSGTPSYMAPEQVLGEPIGPRADQFAVGAVMYELLSGRRAFDGSVREVIAKICGADPIPLSRVYPGVDPELEAIVARALRKDPQQRFPSMATIAQALAGIRQRLDVDGVPTAPANVSPSLAVQTTLAAPPKAAAHPLPVAPPLFGDVAEQSGPRTRVRPAAAVAAVAIAGLIAVFILNREPSPRSEPARGEVASGTTAASPTDSASPATPADMPKPIDPRVAVPPSVQDPKRLQEIERVTRLFNAGGRDVLPAIESALARYPADADLMEWLRRVETRAQDNTDRRRQSAVAAGGGAAPSFADAARAQRDAIDLGRQGMTPAAIRKLWEAEEHFLTAVEWKADSASPGVTTTSGKTAPETENAVRASLLSLSRAYSTLTASAVKAAYPPLTPDEARALDRSFLDYSSYRLDIQIVKMAFRAGRATVNCAIETVVVLRNGQERQSSLSATFVLESSNGAWVITSASRLPN